MEKVLLEDRSKIEQRNNLVKGFQIENVILKLWSYTWSMPNFSKAGEFQKSTVLNIRMIQF